MNVEIGKILHKSFGNLDEAIYLFNGKMYDAAVNRSYYAFFHAAEAILFSKGVFAKSHKGIHNLFFTHFVKTEIFDKKFSTIFSSLSDKRNQVDYDFEETFNKEETELIIEQTKDFLKEVKNYLNK